MFNIGVLHKNAKKSYTFKIALEKNIKTTNHTSSWSLKACHLHEFAECVFFPKYNK